MAALATRLARHIGDADLLRLALTHRSYCAEVAGERSNERLEFLGDAVLDLVVAGHLYELLPDVPEGDLARIRSAVVSELALAPIAGALGVGDALRLGRGEASSGGREKPSILADTLEALIGAAFLAGGLARARALVLEVMSEVIDEAASVAALGDPKNRLQELSARLGLAPPRYEVYGSGPDHAKRYRAEVHLGANGGRGSGRSKKQAERAAAVEALAALEQSADA
jgi:ribonuclease-3